MFDNSEYIYTFFMGDMLQIDTVATASVHCCQISLCVTWTIIGPFFKL